MKLKPCDKKTEQEFQTKLLPNEEGALSYPFASDSRLQAKEELNLSPNFLVPVEEVDNEEYLNPPHLSPDDLKKFQSQFCFSSSLNAHATLNPQALRKIADDFNPEKIKSLTLEDVPEKYQQAVLEALKTPYSTHEASGEETKHWILTPALFPLEAALFRVALGVFEAVSGEIDSEKLQGMQRVSKTGEEPAVYALSTRFAFKRLSKMEELEAHFVSLYNPQNTSVSTDSSFRAYALWTEWFLNFGTFHQMGKTRPNINLDLDAIPDEYFVSQSLEVQSSRERLKQLSLQPVATPADLPALIHAQLPLLGKVQVAQQWYWDEDEFISESSVLKEIPDPIENFGLSRTERALILFLIEKRSPGYIRENLFFFDNHLPPFIDPSGGVSQLTERQSLVWNRQIPWFGLVEDLKSLAILLNERKEEESAEQINIVHQKVSLVRKQVEEESLRRQTWLSYPAGLAFAIAGVTISAVGGIWLVPRLIRWLKDKNGPKDPPTPPSGPSWKAGPELRRQMREQYSSRSASEAAQAERSLKEFLEKRNNPLDDFGFYPVTRPISAAQRYQTPDWALPLATGIALAIAYTKGSAKLAPLAAGIALTLISPEAMAATTGEEIGQSRVVTEYQFGKDERNSSGNTEFISLREVLAGKVNR